MSKTIDVRYVNEKMQTSVDPPREVLEYFELTIHPLNAPPVVLLLSKRELETLVGRGVEALRFKVNFTPHVTPPEAVEAIAQMTAELDRRLAPSDKEGHVGVSIWQTCTLACPVCFPRHKDDVR